MLLVVSACLLGEKCKYNGQSNRLDALCEVVKDHTVISLCPECAGGLPVPRPPAELLNGRIINSQGLDITANFQAGVKACMEKIEGLTIDAAILQERSPSCGIGQIYDGSFSKNLISGDGLFVIALKNRGIPTYKSSELNNLFTPPDLD